MSLSWFCFFEHEDPTRRICEADRRELVATLRGCPGLREGYLHTPSSAPHPHAGKDVAPMLALELDFESVVACEANLGENGCLQRLADPGFLPSLEGAVASQQGMLARSFPIAEPAGGGSGALVCSYLVDYPGPAEDEQAWLDNYVASHAAIMVRFPGIRAALVYTPAVVISRLPFRFATAMLRNRVVFDSAHALGEAHASPVGKEMRADVARFPPYAGGSRHVPMETVIVPGPRRRASRAGAGASPGRSGPQ